MQYTDELNMQNFKLNTSSWDTIKDNVFVRLVNQKYLNQYGENVAHVNFLDLAIVFSVQEKVKGTMISHMLTEDELKTFNVTTEEAKKTAMYNTGTDRKRRVMTFKESILKNNPMYPVLTIPQGMTMSIGGRNNQGEPGVMQDTDDAKQCDNVLILCNKHDTFGSSYMAIPEILEEVYERFNQENFYIVPLSIHQVMCVRSGYASHEGTKPHYEVDDDMLDMIEAFNDGNNRSWKDILSYKIYYYFGDDGKKLFLIK